jgi:four helix bundle protein
LLRSGTSCGANYEEARGGESHADFVHKLSVCWKESRESLYSLKLIHRAELVTAKRIEPLLQEAKELVAILSKSLETCRKRGSPKSSPESETKS